MQLIKNNAVGVETVLVGDVSGKHLVAASGGHINQLFLRVENLHRPAERGVQSHHICRHVKDDGGLLPIRSTAINLGSFFSVTAGQQKCHGGCQLGLALLFGDLNVGGIELAVSIGF